ncbi:hypothetical protein BDB01DRAFT_868110 [Pilobolus umbonatus]|nr:hypothetical protein BDB01DRAFT_868110 [Pilobolus umbonatus]
MNQCAAENKFVLVTSKSNKTQLHLRCEKGGCYENKGLSPENRQRNKGGGVPQIIHSKKKIWFQQVEVAKAISPLMISKVMFETPSRINISRGIKFNKLTIGDINNLKYSTVDTKADDKSNDSATQLINHMKNKGYKVSYTCKILLVAAQVYLNLLQLWDLGLLFLGIYGLYLLVVIPVSKSISALKLNETFY